MPEQLQPPLRPVGLPGWRSRIALFGLLALAAATFAVPSLGGVTPRLVVSSTATVAGQTVTIEGSRTKADEAVARVQIYVPTGFELNSPVGGVSVGTAS